MNDNHYNGALTVSEAADSDDMTALRLAHPDWTLGADQTAPWFATSWNLVGNATRGLIPASAPFRPRARFSSDNAPPPPPLPLSPHDISPRHTLRAQAVPEVREHLLAAIVELAERADWDGLELDWQRHAFHLPQDTAYTLRYTLTDLQRAVRRATNALGQKRGRPFLLTVRVSSR
eukprot:SAG22_NODE_7_length_40155_cov_25.241356_20_plen_176_part_00